MEIWDVIQKLPIILELKTIIQFEFHAGECHLSNGTNGISDAVDRKGCFERVY
jgi:hypothetical protein